MNTLTKIQKQYAVENHNFVYYFLNLNHLKEDDYYDVVIFGYLEAVQNYLENRQAQHYEFSTIAFRKMHDSLCGYWKFCNRKKRKAEMVSLEAEVYQSQNLSLADIVSLPACEDHATVMARIKIQETMKLMTDVEKFIAEKKAAGFTASEIGAMCNTSASGIYGRIYRMRKRLRLAVA